MERDLCQQRLHDALAAADADPAVHGVMAAVLAPRLAFEWQGATPHRRIDGTAASDPATPFRIASVTKMFVACAVLRLVELGRLALDTPIAGLIDPAITRALGQGGLDPAAIRVVHLLGHTSGLRDHVAQPAYAEQVLAQPDRCWSRADQIAIALAAGPPLGSPGAWFQYSDTGYVILGDIMECLTGRPVGHAVGQLLDYARHGAHQTWWERHEPAPAHAGVRAAQYMLDIETGRHDPSFDLFGGGGLISTVGDLALMTRAMVLGQVFDHRGTLAAACLASSATRAPAAAFVHSNAFMLFPVGARFGWGHAGFWGCVGVCLPDLDITIAATINQARPQQPDCLFRLVDALYAAVAG